MALSYCPNCNDRSVTMKKNVMYCINKGCGYSRAIKNYDDHFDEPVAKELTVNQRELERTWKGM